MDATKLKQLLRYDPATGDFWWIARRSGARLDRPAGCISRSNGHRLITIDGVIYLAGRLAWLYMTGAWPEHEVDHRDLDPSNNRWLNLRQATRSQNKGNSGLSKANTSGFKGVSFDPGTGTKPWRARVKFQGRSYCAGRHMTKEAAKASHDQLAAKLFGGFARSG